MLSSREDAEDVLQEVFAAAFNAILADAREINVRPWLYRIARNRSLNHLRKATAVGVDSMDVHYADNGISTSDEVLRRERFKQLIADVQQLPESQRTALLLREIDALSYEQISEAMETTIPSVKSLLVRARISLAEASEARELTCADVRVKLGEAAEGIAKISAPARRHMRTCDRCRAFRKRLKANNVALAAVMPVGGLLVVKKVLSSKLGAGAHVAGGAGAGASAAAGSSGAAGGIATAGAGAIASKAVAGLAAAALVTAGAMEAEHAASHPPPRRAPATARPSVRAQHPESTVTGAGERSSERGLSAAVASSSAVSASSTRGKRAEPRKLKSADVKKAGRSAKKSAKGTSRTSTAARSTAASSESSSRAVTTSSGSSLAEASDASHGAGGARRTEVVTETTKLPGEASTSSTVVSTTSTPTPGSSTGATTTGSATGSTTTSGSSTTTTTSASSTTTTTSASSTTTTTSGSSTGSTATSSGTGTSSGGGATGSTSGEEPPGVVVTGGTPAPAAQ